MKKIFAILIFLLGVALIVASMLLIPLNLVQEVLIMDIVVLSIIWSLLSYDILVPLATDKAQYEAPEVGHWGVVWAGQLWYIIPALLIGILGAIFTWDFIYQLLAQCACLIGLLFVFLFSYFTRHAIRKTAAYEKTLLDGRAQMCKALREVQDMLVVYPDGANQIRQSVNDIESQLRYITPSEKQEARDYETTFINLAKEVVIALPHLSTDEHAIEQTLARMQHILSRRKEIKD